MVSHAAGHTYFRPRSEPVKQRVSNTCPMNLWARLPVSLLSVSPLLFSQDCVQWSPVVYNDLLCSGDGTGRGLVMAYFNTGSLRGSTAGLFKPAG